MVVTRNIKDFVSYAEDSIFEALEKINRNKSRIVFVVSEHSVLLGCVSDGDVRRWLTTHVDADLKKSVASMMNGDFKFTRKGASKREIQAQFRAGVDCIPILDDAGRLFQLAFQNDEGIFVGSREISANAPAFIIAEIGNNHQGDLTLAKTLIDHAVIAGADCAKFQMRNMEKLYKNGGDSNDAASDLGAQYTMDLLARFQLTNEELFEAFEYCKSKDIIPLCTPWDLDSLEVLERYGMPAYKVASADFTNYELLKAVAETGKPFFCSTGMSTEAEIRSSVAFLDELSADFVLLHCNSTYPTPFKDVNLKYMSRLREISGRLVGYSGHERGIAIPIASVALGASVIEKHLTVDRSFEGTDHKVSLLPDEFAEMVVQVRNVEEGLGCERTPREVTQGELMNRETLAKSLVAKKPIQKGEVITRDLIEVKSPGQGLQPNRLDELIGKVTNRSLTKGDYFYESDITGAVVKSDRYIFRRPVGVPVRYHDYKAITEGVKLDFVEFHLSYKDLDVDLKEYFNGEESIGFAVHSPELFANDHILDLCAADPEYRNRSIKELSRVFTVTRQLQRFFPATKNPVAVVNVGGWDSKGFVSEKKKAQKYKLVADSLLKLDSQGIQIAVQTMPPFPWHFGGQSYHNLFICADEIVEFCEKNQSVKVCLDVSHSMMACNYFGWDLYEFIDKVAPYTVHLHIVDAKGVDGEGVEMGLGDVDFYKMARILTEKAHGVQFIPEVWQGHKNGGEGFWKALNFLSNVPL